MKSSEEQLRRRGFADERDYQRLRDFSDEQLLKKMYAGNPSERTAAIALLSELDEERTHRLLTQLAQEKALYTRLAICQRLEKGNVQTAVIMLDYLGKIGSNQYTEIPTEVSKKKSYPLPRDLVARSLGKMTPAIIETLMTALDQLSIYQLSELIDAIGFLIFYHPELATEENCDKIIQLIEKNDEELIRWKALICLSAFPCSNSKRILEKYAQRTDFLGKEANRSIIIIQEK